MWLVPHNWIDVTSFIFKIELCMWSWIIIWGRMIVKKLQIKKIEKSAATESICKLHSVTIYWHMIWPILIKTFATLIFSSSTSWRSHEEAKTLRNNNHYYTVLYRNLQILIVEITKNFYLIFFWWRTKCTLKRFPFIKWMQK